ncbi:O-antigen ligase family protein [Salaquimonas pukyongi]|uniref:O-antigen ligase family protein n=1 Tax=Salaquimonas pukyongi TaxID=2712698 RepID=UPI001FCDFDD9|nr:O-antigen ligase family protein [Salaquimonas pukyongi]
MTTASAPFFAASAPLAASDQRAANAAAGQMLANGAIAFAVFLGGFVIFEPAPYELFLAALLGVWFICGMRIPREIAPLLFLFTLFNFGGVISSLTMEEYTRGLIYVAISYFLALTSVFFAIVIRQDMGRLRLIFRAYIVAATITSLLGIIGYFNVGGFEIFTRYERAMGAFQDPNVFAPFLVTPILYLIYGVVNRSPTLLPLRAGLLAILLLGLFLAFSRAAWGLSVVSGGLFYLLLIINEQKARTRLKYIVIGVAGIVAIMLLLLVALQFDEVSKLFAERAKAVQDYDGGRIGRFARHLLGFELALSKPLGIGPLEFGYIFGEDTHNNLVKALMAHGWIGFVTWVAVMVWTLVGGFKLLFRQRPWLPYLQIAYVVFFGHVLIGNVIDTDHWRHFYLLIGIIWGCMALEKSRQNTNARQMSVRENMPGSSVARTEARLNAAPTARNSLLEA